MPETQIDRDAIRILRVMAEAPRGEYVDRSEVSRLSGLAPDRVNDAVAFLVASGYAEWIQTFGTAPYDFNAISITSRSRYESQRLAATGTEEAGAEQVDGREPSVRDDEDSIRMATLPPAPIGSPYGFTDEDREAVSERRGQPGRLHAVLGHQSSSEFFDTSLLRSNVQAMLRQAVEMYNAARQGVEKVSSKMKSGIQIDWR